MKTQKNRINYMRRTSSKVNLSKTIHNWRHPLRIVPYLAIIYASFSKRAPMTVTWSNFVNNTLSAYIYQRVYIYACLDAIKVLFSCLLDHETVIGARLLKDALIIARYGTMRRGRYQSCIVLERCTFGEVSRMQFILFLCVFISDESLIWRRCQKFVSGLIIMGIWQVRRLLRWGLGVVPVIIYHINAVPVVQA